MDPAAPKPAGPIRRVLAPIRGRLIGAAVLAGLGTMLALVPLAGIAHIARVVLGSGPGPLGAAVQHDVWHTVGIAVACLFAGMALVSAGEYTAHLADARITHRLRLDGATRLSRVPLGWFTGRASGEVRQVLQDDVAALHGLTAHFYTAVGRAAGAIVASVVYLFAVDWRMAVVTLLPFPGFVVFLRRAMHAGASNLPGFAERLGRLSGATVEFVDGIAVVKAFGQPGRVHRGYQQAVDGFADAFDAYARPLVASMAHAHAMIAPVTVLGVVLVAGTLFRALGWITAIDVLPFALVGPGICAPLLLLHTLLHDLDGATAAARRVLDLLDTPVLPSPAAGAQQVPAGDAICFEHVGHTYDDGPPALSDVSFTLEPGTVTAVVGPSGSGKSTLARLLLRFFDPATGRITLGGADLRDIDTAALYRRIGFVLQDVRLIRASVHDNIALGQPSAGRERVEAAARAAHVHDRIVALPRGYDSIVGDDALLSDGERQRISIARAVLLDAPVLVLDEATAAADADSEAHIHEALSRFARGRTVLVIAHRLHTVVHADHIIVLDHGAIVEQGTHAQLLRRQGRYARLWARTGADGDGASPAAEPSSC